MRSSSPSSIARKATQLVGATLGARQEADDQLAHRVEMVRDVERGVQTGGVLARVGEGDEGLFLSFRVDGAQQVLGQDLRDAVVVGPRCV